MTWQVMWSFAFILRTPLSYDRTAIVPQHNSPNLTAPIQHHLRSWSEWLHHITGRDNCGWVHRGLTTGLQHAQGNWIRMPLRSCDEHFQIFFSGKVKNFMTLLGQCSWLYSNDLLCITQKETVLMLLLNQIYMTKNKQCTNCYSLVALCIFFVHFFFVVTVA